MLDIATYWNEKSPLDVKVYSNCDEVALYLNDELVTKQKADTDKNCTNLQYPPFTFKMKAFKAGSLKAIGFINGEQIMEDVVKTPLKAVGLKLSLDESGKRAEAGCNDVLFLYISAIDQNGTLIPDFTGKADLAQHDNIELMNVGDLDFEAGIATALIRIGDKKGDCTLSATSGDLSSDDFSFSIK